MKIAVILFNLGGPDKLENVEPFLFNLFYDPAILNFPKLLRYPLAKLISNNRAPIAKKIYKEMGGFSPLLKLTEDQARSLEQSLNFSQNNIIYKLFIAMRCWHPRASETVQKVKQFEPNEVILLPLYPQFSATTSGSSINEWMFYRIVLLEMLDSVVNIQLSSFISFLRNYTGLGDMA